jgi:hypothetical protein
MDQQLALWAGYSALGFLTAAGGYYPLHRLREHLVRKDSPAADGWLRVADAAARATHPYLASLISLAAAYHVIAMLLTRPFGLKTGSGLLVSAAVVFMANSGWLLKFRPQAGRVRRAHRFGMSILAALAFIHFFL